MRRGFCTGFRQGGHETQSCCEVHDSDYEPGSGISRFDADIRLMMCLAAHGKPWRGIAFFIIVRAIGWARYQGIWAARIRNAFDWIRCRK